MAGTGVGEAQFGIPVDITGGTIIVIPTANRAAVTMRSVTIIAAGTPVQGWRRKPSHTVSIRTTSRVTIVRSRSRIHQASTITSASDFAWHARIIPASLSSGARASSTSMVTAPDVNRT